MHMSEAVDCGDREFESRWQHGCSSLVFVFRKERSLRRDDHSFRGVLLSLACLNACNLEASNKRGGLDPSWAVVPQKKSNLPTCLCTYLFTFLLACLLAPSLSWLLACSHALFLTRLLSCLLARLLACSLACLFDCSLARALASGRTNVSMRQRVPRLLKKFHAFRRTQKFIHMFAALRYLPLNAVHTLQSYSFEISFNTISSKPASSMFSFSVRFSPPKLCMHVYIPRYVTFFTHPISWFY
jgi:hypothetical protein